MTVGLTLDKLYFILSPLKYDGIMNRKNAMMPWVKKSPGKRRVKYMCTPKFGRIQFQHGNCTCMFDNQDAIDGQLFHGSNNIQR